MKVFSREKDKAEVEKAKEPAGTFFSNSSQSDAAVTKQQYSKVEEAGHVFGYNPDLELQTQISGSSREYGQAAANASAANVNVPPTRTATAMRTKAEMLAGDNRMLFSTHRAAMIDPQQVEVERAAKKDAQENRAWRSLTAMLELFAR
jgi:hypothetical protein